MSKVVTTREIFKPVSEEEIEIEESFNEIGRINNELYNRQLYAVIIIYYLGKEFRETGLLKDIYDKMEKDKLFENCSDKIKEIFARFDDYYAVSEEGETVDRNTANNMLDFSRKFSELYELFIYDEDLIDSLDVYDIGPLLKSTRKYFVKNTFGRYIPDGLNAYICKGMSRSK